MYLAFGEEAQITRVTPLEATEYSKDVQAMGNK
jgi:hypothetical protein